MRFKLKETHVIEPYNIKRFLTWNWDSASAFFRNLWQRYLPLRYLQSNFTLIEIVHLDVIILIDAHPSAHVYTFDKK